MYLIYYCFLYPIMRILSLFRKNKNKILIIQTAKIGDYANTSVVFELARKFDIVLDKINLSFADYDDRIGRKFVINDYRGTLKKFYLAFMIFWQNYDEIYVFMPNNFNMFLAKMGYPKKLFAISHYKNSSLFKYFAIGAKLTYHTKNDLTLLTYLKMFGVSNLSYKKSIQNPICKPTENIINSNKFKVGISLSAGNRIKTITPKTWDKIFSILKDIDCEIYVFGVGNELDLLKSIDTQCICLKSLVNKISLNHLPFYIGQMDLYISSDTGNYYIADSMEIPTICLMGPCFASEQRGVFNSLIITPPFKPFTAVFNTIYDRKCDEYFDISSVDEKKILKFINEVYSTK